MSYRKFGLASFFRKIDSEAKARELIWKSRFGVSGFRCTKCQGHHYYAMRARVEVRECGRCGHQVRLRSKTIFEKSHLPLLVWVRAIFLVTQDKRGISAMEIQRQLDLSRYETAWLLLKKIRHAMAQRDKGYKIGGLIEFDGGEFGRRLPRINSVNKKEFRGASVLIGVETKQWKDKEGKKKPRAGFAKVVTATENYANVQTFVNTKIKTGSTIKTDGKLLYRTPIEGVETQRMTIHGDHKVTKSWQPWVHRFISNAKTWILGTHHGVSQKHLDLYLAEYAYRFNRRHDPDRLFDRLLKACSLAIPAPQPVSTG